MKDKIILDACCGSRMFWFDKNNPKVLFTDIREEETTLCDGRVLKVAPDMLVDFTNMPFESETFQMVVMDPPHMKILGKKSWMAKKYGVLKPNWKEQIRVGTNECMRVLKRGGTFIFKWNEAQVKLSEVLGCIEHKPLFGHTSGKHGKTIWLAFLKTDNNG